jgi:itaconate CoA-transferase
MTLPLDDITVVALEQAVAGPLATRQLADLGARVIKVERPDGGDFARRYDTVVQGISSAFVWLNRGKESVVLDLKCPADLTTLHRLLARADVMVANLAPRTLSALGLTASQLAEKYPALIVCTISGYHPDGPSPQRKAYDALVQGETGLMELTGYPDMPAKVGISVADIAAGQCAYAGVLAAIRHRDRTGEALPVQVSLFGALTEWLAYPLYYTIFGGTAPVAMGTSHPTIAPYGAVESADGGKVIIAVQNEHEWQHLCTDVLDAPNLIEDQRFSSNSSRVAHRAELDSAIGAKFRQWPKAVLIERLDAANIAWAELNSIADLATHPELAGDERWLQTDTPCGTIRTLRPVGTPGGRVDVGAVPGLGEHSDGVLAEVVDASPGGA